MVEEVEGGEGLLAGCMGVRFGLIDTTYRGNNVRYISSSRDGGEKFFPPVDRSGWRQRTTRERERELCRCDPGEEVALFNKEMRIFAVKEKFY